MNQENRQCQNCKNQFLIEPDDFAFYKKISVPPPTFCPDCRNQRRRAWRNDLSFYKSQCSLCGRSIITLYSPDKRLVVYCQKCWWSDAWDGKGYGRDYDFSRSFFEQFRELQNVVPLISMVNDDGIGSVNCEYAQNVSLAKNCYMVSASWKNEECAYSLQISGPEVRETFDCIDIFQKCEMIYDSIFLESCYRARNCYRSFALINCMFCYECRDCEDCFMSIGLRRRKYCFKNKQYSKEEYGKIVKDYALDTWSGAERAKKEFREFILGYPHEFAILRNCINCTGDQMFNCKNMRDSFNVRGSEDTKYFQNGNLIKSGYDMATGGENEDCYEGITPDNDYRTLFSIFSYKNSHAEYVENCHSGQNLFGCAGLKSAQYCILNKQYSKEEYQVIRAKIVAQMKEAGEYGEFFPANLSHFGYNETTAQLYFPLTKEEALIKGCRWQDNFQFTTGKETVRSCDLPNAIADVKDSIMKEVLACVECRRNYLITHQELQFYRKTGVSLPRKCFYCRNLERYALKLPFKLWERSCSCGGDASSNGIYKNSRPHFHGGSACSIEFETPYAPSRPEIVYCEQCYQAEVV
ncbi:MAG: hypothetical protein AAB495_00245 [Patescibacteria group bacterium]